MTHTIEITGYDEMTVCDHCGRALKHGIRIDDGRTVGATCFANKLTAPRKAFNGKPFRLDASAIVSMAKVVQNVRPENWSRFAVSADSIKFVAV